MSAMKHWKISIRLPGLWSEFAGMGWQAYFPALRKTSCSSCTPSVFLVLPGAGRTIFIEKKCNRFMNFSFRGGQKTRTMRPVLHARVARQTKHAIVFELEALCNYVATRATKKHRRIWGRSVRLDRHGLKRMRGLAEYRGIDELLTCGFRSAGVKYCDASSQAVARRAALDGVCDYGSGRAARAKRFSFFYSRS
jgi:hypothetical protein